MRGTRFISMVIVGLFALFTASASKVHADDNSVEIKTRLGIKKTGSVSKNSYIDIEVYEGEKASVKINSISSISFEGKLHAIQTAWGDIFKGRCLGTITVESEGTKKEYSVNSIKSLTVLSHFKEEKARKNDAKTIKWVVSGVRSKELSGKQLRDVCFVGTYYSSAGYIMGGSDRTGTIQSPYIKVEGDEMTVQLDDFSRFDLKKEAKSWSITVWPPDDEPVKGELVLQVSDSKGTHPLTDWRVKGTDEKGVEYSIIHDTLSFSQVQGTKK